MHRILTASCSAFSLKQLVGVATTVVLDQRTRAHVQAGSQNAAHAHDCDDVMMMSCPQVATSLATGRPGSKAAGKDDIILQLQELSRLAPQYLTIEPPRQPGSTLQFGGNPGAKIVRVNRRANLQAVRRLLQVCFLCCQSVCLLKALCHCPATSCLKSHTHHESAKVVCCSRCTVSRTHVLCVGFDGALLCQE